MSATLDQLKASLNDGLKQTADEGVRSWRQGEDGASLHSPSDYARALRDINHPDVTRNASEAHKGPIFKFIQ